MEPPRPSTAFRFFRSLRESIPQRRRAARVLQHAQALWGSAHALDNAESFADRLSVAIGPGSALALPPIDGWSAACRQSIARRFPLGFPYKKELLPMQAAAIAYAHTHDGELQLSAVLETLPLKTSSSQPYDGDRYDPAEIWVRNPLKALPFDKPSIGDSYYTRDTSPLWYYLLRDEVPIAHVPTMAYSAAKQIANVTYKGKLFPWTEAGETAINPQRKQWLDAVGGVELIQLYGKKPPRKRHRRFEQKHL